MTFVEDETALPSSPDLTNPKHYLVPAIQGFTHLLQPREWVGSWKIVQRGKRGCTITLRLGTADGEGGSVSAACAKGSVPARLERWSLEGMNLMLWGKNDLLLAFAPTANGRWVAEPGAWSISK
jgi:hypothetical protein